MARKLNSYYLRDKKKLIMFLTNGSRDVLWMKADVGKNKKNPEYVVLDNLIGDTKDVYDLFESVGSICSLETRVVITYYNHLWELVLKLASYFGFTTARHEQNWLDQKDIANLLNLTGFDVVNQGKRLLIPVEIPYISEFVNRWLCHLPLLNELCLTTWIVARRRPNRGTEKTVTIVIPARNEEGNIKRAIRTLPKFGKNQEVIFVEGNSTDKTWEAIQKEVEKEHRNGLKIVCFKQKGKGKADAVRVGFDKATGEILMILDADLTVDPKELPKFYEAIVSGQGEFINGSRMVYPMEREAMRTLNKMGNTFFSWVFTWILGQRFKDTLCGTKVLTKDNYQKIWKNRKFFGDFDPFGDFDLIFGAVKQNLKIVEIPVRYKERTYGSTNISRFKHGLQLLKMTTFAFVKFRVW